MKRREYKRDGGEKKRKGEERREEKREIKKEKDREIVIESREGRH